jgi:hypothetical protein
VENYNRINSGITVSSLPADPMRGDLPTMPDPTKDQPEIGPHVPTTPDPLEDPEQGQRLPPPEPDPENKPPKINDPLPNDGVKRIA